MSNSQNKKNEQQNDLCTTLTEQLKKGELEAGWYYVLLFSNEEYITFIDGNWVVDDRLIGADIKEVLTPVPSYEEWKSTGKFAMEAIKVAEENQQLKEKLEKAEATLLDIDGGWVTDEIRSKISEYFVYTIGEKK